MLAEKYIRVITIKLIQEVVEWIPSTMYLADHTIQISAELIDVCSIERREEDARRVLLGKPTLAKVVE